VSSDTTACMEELRHKKKQVLMGTTGCIILLLGCLTRRMRTIGRGS